MNSFWVFDGSAPKQSGAFEKWWNRQLSFLESLPPSELSNPKNCSRFLQKWYNIYSCKFPPTGEKGFRFKNLFKKRALYIFSKNLIYIEAPKIADLRNRTYWNPNSGINFMWGHPDNYDYKQFEVFKNKLIF